MAVRSRTLLRGSESVSVEGFSDLYSALKQLSRATERKRAQASGD
jgi:hypothetical protein